MTTPHSLDLTNYHRERDTAAERPEIVDRLPGIRVIHVHAGSACSVRKESLLPYMAESARVVVEHAKAAQERDRAYAVRHAHLFMSGLVARRLKQAPAIPYVSADEACVALLGLSYALIAKFRTHQIRVTATIAGGMRARFSLERFPDLDPARLQDLRDVARAVRFAATQTRGSVVAEASWP